MRRPGWQVGVLAVLFALVVLVGGQAQGGKTKTTDEGKAEDFKGKTFDLKEKGRAAIFLTFPADRRAVVTVKSKEKSDVNLIVYDGKKVVAKDDSPGPDCRVTFKPKEECKLRLVVINQGPGENSSTLKVSFPKKKVKE
jgi:hypothetical protein